LVFWLLLVNINVIAQDIEVVPGRLIIKIKPEFEQFVAGDDLNIYSLKPIFDAAGVKDTRQLFPKSEKPTSTSRSPVDTRLYTDITTIYELTFDTKVNPYKLARALLNTRTLEYAEPRYLAQTTSIPSDALIDSLWHLPIIKAFEAWEIDTGSNDVLIAIIDTGVDMDHPDLMDAIAVNEDEIPNNGLDDDDNGFVDDVRGWNFFNDNNNPDETGFSHGTHVAGLSNGITNNEIGIAGTGWACKLLPVKSGDKLNLPFGYDGIVYAADNGADIINCSWGSFGESFFAADIVRYATYNKQAMLIGSAGNNNQEIPFYPAAYPEVLSVGASDSLDQKADFSNYGFTLDVLSPGAAIFSLKNDGYGYDSGTSMAGPIVAGLAGLLKSRYPQLMPRQLQQQIRVTADTGIYDLESNATFEGKLGTGRINMERALLAINTPGLSAEYWEISDNDDMVFSPTEEIMVGVELANFLLNAPGVVVTLTTDNPNVSVISGTWMAGNITQNGRANNLNNPFLIRVNETASNNELVALKLEAKVQGTDYKYTVFKSFNINQDFVNVTVNNIKTTVSKHGLIGYTDFLQSSGIGFSYLLEDDLLYEGGLMIGVETKGQTKVVDRIRNGSFADQDFWEANSIRRMVPSGEEAFLATGSFTDSSAIRDEIGLSIKQEIKAYDDSAHQNYVLLAYEIQNLSEARLENLSVGVFADWDIIDANENHGKTAYGKRLGYVHYTGDNQVTAGIQALTLLPFNSYMIDNIRGGEGGVDLYDSTGYDSQDKLTTLTNERLQAGITDDEGNDVIQIMAMKGITLEPLEVAKVCFALHAGNSIDAVLKSADAAYERFHGAPPGADVEGIADVGRLWPNPTRDDLTLEITLRSRANFIVEVYNTQGLKVLERETPSLFAGYNQILVALPELSTGIYFLRISNSDFIHNIPFQYLND
jgi:hypothetical protein